MSAAEVRTHLEEIGLNEHKELVRRVCVHCRSHDVAEDSVQEAYVELLLHADEIRSVGRATIGVRLVKLDDGARVVGFDTVNSDADAEGEEAL